MSAPAAAGGHHTNVEECQPWLWGLKWYRATQGSNRSSGNKQEDSRLLFTINTHRMMRGKLDRKGYLWT